MESMSVLVILRLQNSKEGTLRNFDIADHLHVVSLEIIVPPIAP